MPRADTGFSQLNINLPPGSTLAQTDATLRHLSDITNRYPAVAHTYTIAGTGGDTAKGEILIRSCPHQARTKPACLRTTTARHLAAISDIRFAFKNEEAQRDIKIILTGQDPATLSATAHTLKQQI